jgi:DNA-binding transcriptional regulator YhcF (GntR family)
MNFNENTSIYLQITEYVKEQILLNKWLKEEKVASVRDLASELQVNPNTVMRAYDSLQQEGVIYNRRGIGNFVASDAVGKILESRKIHFLDSEVPVFFKNMILLGIGFDELERLYNNYIRINSKKD